jgi:uncharacterized protein
MLSRYSVVVPLDNNQDYIIYNTLFQKTVCVNSDLLSLILNISGDVDCISGDMEHFEKKYREDIKCLADMGIIRSGGTDETKFLKQRYEALRNDSSSVNLTILTTHSCNLACSYCYEAGRFRNEYMEDETVESIIRWLKTRIKDTGAENLRLVFYGGEPLLRIEPIFEITKQMRRWAEHENVLVTVCVITNGVLLDRKMAKDLSRCGVDYVKITFDGVGESHDKKRPTITGQGSFDRIFANLQDIKGLINISIGCNFDDDNYESLLALPSLLKKCGLKEHIKSIRFKPLKNTLAVAGTVSQHCIVGSYTSEEVDRMLSFRKVLQKNGYTVEEDFSLGPCEYHHHHSFTIDVNGDIYPCGGFPGIRQFVMGNVGNSGSGKIRKKEESRINEKCGECGYFCSCGGGCRFLSYLKNGNPEDITCELPYFRKAAPEILKDTLKSQMISAE